MSYGPPPYPGPRYAESPVRPPLPQTVQIAFYLMLAGAAMQVLGFIVTVVRISALRDQLRRQLIDNGTAPTDSSLNTLVTVVIAIAGVFAVIGVGLWIWMAFTNRAGRQWARITGTVFFGIFTLSTLASLVTLAAGGSSRINVGSSTPASFAVSAISWLIGLVTVVLLWNKGSGAYFRPVHAPYGQAPVGYPYGQSPQPVQPQPYDMQPPYPVEAPPPGPPQAPPPAGGQAPSSGPGQSPPAGPGQAQPGGQQGEGPPPPPPNWQNPA
ncbi:hypothetical protein [Actinomadura rupiterrae]|uniref:hypothetical protein n=1 Tax=Actinomadura rupiterrae TaxID=559627 RepID=UPI0020A59083|nr:hypothetical protein [Actinomadura rupiterrae]MCP2336650.1 hypothetical protein [Actinomadura rupiterrae]